MMATKEKLIEKWEKEISEVKQQRKNDNKAGDHSFCMEYDTAEKKISEFIQDIENLNGDTEKRTNESDCTCTSSSWNKDAGCMVCDDCGEKI